LYDETDTYRMIGSSVTDPGWLEQVPAGRPTLVVAEGLLMYVSESEVRELAARVTDRFGNGELLFDALSPAGPRLSKMFTKGIVKWESGTPARSGLGALDSNSSSRPPHWRATSRFRSRRSAWSIG
jgi:O-methyltransferase involved in polyketide biosynthesis